MSGIWNRLKSRFGAKAPTPAALFRALARDVARATEGIDRVEDGDDEWTLLIWRRGNDEKHQLNLQNLFAETRDVPEDARADTLRRFLSGLANEPSIDELDWADARENLVPALRSVSFFYGLGQGNFVTRPFAPFLVEALVVDTPSSMAYVSHTELARWNISVEAAFDAAIENIAGCEHRVEPYDDTASSPLWHVGTGDAYESSRLLIPGWLADFRGRVRGEPIAIVPERNTLIVGGDGDLALVTRMIDIAEHEAKASPRHISTMVYRGGENGLVVPWEVSADHPLAKRIRHAQHLLAGTQYTSQRQHLEALHAKTGTDIFVGSYGAILDPEGNETSYTTWAENVESLLPRTDEIIFGLGIGGEDPETLRVDWENAAHIVGDCLVRDPELDPPRYRTRTWPNGDQIAALRRAGRPVRPRS